MAQQLKFDGFDVSVHEATFTGKFDLDEEESESIKLDRVVVFLVAARVGKVLHAADKDGEIKRTNTFVVSEAQMLQGELRDQAIQFLAYPTQGSLDFDVEPEDEDDDVAPVSSPAQAAEANGHSDVVLDETVDVTDTTENSIYPQGRKDEVLAKFLDSPTTE